jgi:hypothetical protein
MLALASAEQRGLGDVEPEHGEVAHQRLHRDEEDGPGDLPVGRAPAGGIPGPGSAVVRLTERQDVGGEGEPAGGGAGVGLDEVGGDETGIVFALARPSADSKKLSSTACQAGSGSA